MSSTTIPRFLLPQRSVIWRRTAFDFRTRTIRNASNKASNKPNVLEKPTKFNPPSHGARLRKEPPRYPGPSLSAQQKEAQRTRQYPNMMPPEGSFLNWFLTNRSIHIYITLGTLFSMAGFTFMTNFKRTSKFADMLPSWSDFFLHPITGMRTCIEVLRLHTAAVSAETSERRQRTVEDVQKRGEYRKAHGLNNEGFGGWTAKSDKDELGPAITLDEASPTAAGPVANDDDGGLGAHIESRKKPLKKWLGIW